MLVYVACSSSATHLWVMCLLYVIKPLHLLHRVIGLLGCFDSILVRTYSDCNRNRAKLTTEVWLCTYLRVPSIRSSFLSKMVKTLVILSLGFASYFIIKIVSYFNYGIVDNIIINFNRSSNSNRNSSTETSHKILRRIDDMTIAGEISTRRISTGGARRISRRSQIGQYSGPSGNNMSSCFSSRGNEESPMIFRHHAYAIKHSTYMALRESHVRSSSNRKGGQWYTWRR